MKLIMAYVVTNYDIESLEKRPENHWFGSSTAPPFESIIRIRRRPRQVEPTACNAATQTLVEPTHQDSSPRDIQKPRPVKANLHFYQDPVSGRLPTVDEIDTVLTPELTNTKEIIVSDVRGREKEFQLDDQGFCFVKHDANIVDWSNDDHVQASYYPQIEKLLMNMYVPSDSPRPHHQRGRSSRGSWLTSSIAPARVLSSSGTTKSATCPGLSIAHLHRRCVPTLT